MHGSGLSHLLFLPEEAVVLELFPRHFDSHMFHLMAKLSGTLPDADAK